MINLEYIYDTNDQSYRIIEYTDKCFLDGKFEEVNEFILKINIERLTTSGLRTLVSSTHCAKDKLSNYSKVSTDVYNRMLVLKGPEITNRLFKFLK